MAKSAEPPDDAELLASVTVEVRGREIGFTVEHGDAMRAACDVLLLKHAQASYGLDLRVIEAFEEQSGGTESPDLQPGVSMLVEGRGVVGAEYVMFVGTPGLSELGLDDVRRWAAVSIARLGEFSRPASTLAATVHGVEINVGENFDEGETLAAEVNGFLAALSDESIDVEVELIRIIERDEKRAHRLAEHLDKSVLGEATIGSHASDYPDPDTYDDADTSGGTPAPRLRGKVDWSPDEPNDVDELGRRLVAEELAKQLREFNDHHPGSSYMFLVDGPWGAGKSTLLRFLHSEVTTKNGFFVVEFDAWRQSRSGPPWLLLMTTLRTALKSGGHLNRRQLIQERARRIGRANLVALGLFIAVLAALVVIWLTGWLELDRSTGLIVAALSFVAVLWPVTHAVGQFLTVDSHSGARRFIDTRSDPMEDIAVHFDWLRRTTERPVLLIIDDLDRCRADYVVELLDNVQKLIRQSPSQSEHRGPPPALLIAVAADARWLRESYQSTHHEFSNAVNEPGRPLGSLFLDKLFQLRVPVPALSPELQRTFLASVLGSKATAKDQPAAIEITNLRESVESAESHEAVLAAVRSADHAARLLVAPDVLKRLDSGGADGVSESSHALDRFANLLEPNPRSVLRFTMAFSILRAARAAEGNAVSTDSLGLWTIVSVRWPLLAEYLASKPEEAKHLFTTASYAEEHIPEELVDLFVDPSDELRHIFDHTEGNLRDPNVIRQCVGIV